MRKRGIVGILTAAAVFFSNFPVVYGITPKWDGYRAVSEVKDEISLIDFNNISDIISSGAKASGRYASDGLYSACWMQNTSKELLFKDVPKDWTEYDFIELYVYAENADNTRFLFGPVCYPLEGQSENGSYFYTYTTVNNGWNHFVYNLNTLTESRQATFNRIKNLRFTVGGWGLSVNENAKYYISSVKLKRFNIGGSLKENYSLDVLQKTNDILKDAVAVYALSPNVVKNAEVTTFDNNTNNVRSIIECDTVCVPMTFFSDFLDAETYKENDNITIKYKQTEIALTLGKDECSVNGAVKKLKAAPKETDGIVYIPAEDISEFLGKNVVSDGKLIIIGNNDDIELFALGDSINDYHDVVQYLAAYERVNPENVKEMDFARAKDMWRYTLVSDKDIDTEDADIKKKLETVAAEGQSAWNTLNKGNNVKEIFNGITSTTTASMTNQYQRLYKMALAYGTYGNRLYMNESLKADILYALEWLYNNRYGQKEIDGTGWRSTSEYNWWDWQIGSAERLINTMMIMEEHLTDRQKTNYLALFDHLVPRVTSTGANRMDLAKSVIGSGLLQNNVQRVIDARDAIDQTFLYADNGRNNKQGFYTDGSYIFHEAHPMNGTYGIEQLAETGTFLSILKDTAFEYTNPQIQNVQDWYYNAYEPLMYQGAIMRMVRGRNNPPAEHTKGAEVIAYMLDMLDALDTEAQTRFKSIIKYTVQNDTTRNYYTSLSLARTKELKKIMSDENVIPRSEYFLNKVYYNMDKIVHQREDFAAGISMSSSRIFPYECINGQNSTGWYMGDGMMTVYNKNDFLSYNDQYWKNIDPYRLPGITADTQKRPEVNIATGNEWRSKQDFVGGVSLNSKFGTAAMSLESYHSDVEIGTDKGSYGGPAPIHDCNLTAKKAWFMFDDEIVSLGADINAKNDVNVLTIVDNRLSEGKKQLKETEYSGTKYTVEAVWASQEPESENIAANTIDEQSGTKWAAEGEADITWDLGDVKVCGFINLSFANGNIRKQIFDLYTSEDGISWTKRFSGMSSGVTESAEAFDLGNCNARYVRLNSHGSTGTSQWISLTNAEIYPRYEGQLPKVEAPEYIGTDIVSAEGAQSIELDSTDKSLLNKKWVSLEKTGGYYFPSGGNIFARRTTGAESFFELWFDHGVNPNGGEYAYVTLPGKNEQETAAYANTPDVEILSNNKKIQAVYEKNLKTTGIVFWEAGKINDITVSAPMIVMMKNENGNIEISVSDPTHKVDNAEITFNRDIKCVSSDSRVQLVGNTLKIDFKNSAGRSIEAKLRD